MPSHIRPAPTTRPAPAPTFSLTPLGYVESCFPEKFGIPRQPGLTNGPGIIRLMPPFDDPRAFEGLSHYSHLWISFIFHLSPTDSWSPRIRPPRLGGNQRLGVFASRSPFRPNRLGLSSVRHHGLIEDAQGLGLRISGHDLVDGTPVVDIKPYLPYADALPDATTTLAEPPRARMAVEFEPDARTALAELRTPRYAGLETLIIDTLSQDPRPAYRRGKPDTKQYGVRLFDLDIRFRVEGNRLKVAAIVKLV